MYHCGNTREERTPNKSQHRKLTLEKNNFPPLLPGLELATFRSRVRSFYQQATPAAHGRQNAAGCSHSLDDKQTKRTTNAKRQQQEELIKTQRKQNWARSTTTDYSMSFLISNHALKRGVLKNAHLALGFTHFQKLLYSVLRHRSAITAESCNPRGRSHHYQNAL